jgi:hypothetical protein
MMKHMIPVSLLPITVQSARRSSLCVILGGLVLFGTSFGGHAAETPPEIEFNVLLIIKKRTEAWSPLFLPVRAEMSPAEVATARRCFEIETPEMVKDITRGKVRFVPTVYISEEPLRFWNPGRRDSAEIHGPELFEEFARIAKPGQYDSVGYYFLPRDGKSGYAIPRAGYGVGWFDGKLSAGVFAVHATDMNPRDEIFLHEWLHGLEQFYHRKPGVRLPNGWLHGNRNYPGYREQAYRPGDTFKGWTSWYKDFLNCEVKESDGFSGLGPSAWQHGPMRLAQPPQFPAANMTPPSSGTYPQWVYRLMEGDLSSAKLGEDLLNEASDPAGSDGLGSWTVKRWTRSAANKVERRTAAGVSAIRIQNHEPDDVQLTRRIGLEPFKNYVFCAEVKARGVEITQSGGRFGVTLAAGSSRSPNVIEGITGWIPVSICFTTGEKSEDAELRLGLGGFSSVAKGEVIFGNVRLRQVLYPSTE